MNEGVTFVVPVKNGERWLAAVVDAILAQDDGRPFELLVVDDRSTDSSATILDRWRNDARVLVLHGEGRGPAAAMNLALGRASQPLVAQVDQDVVLLPGWLERLATELADQQVAAAQGTWVTDRAAPLPARLSGYDLELRYARIRGRFTDHVCTGNSLYRLAAVRQVGGFDESLGYGLDNDMSYRLAAAGFKLVFCKPAASVHHWRPTLAAYLQQQYGLGYGRLEVIARHPRHVAGDMVSGLRMILQVPATLLVLVAATTTVALALTGGGWWWPALISGIVLAALIAERSAAAFKAAARFHDPLALAIMPVHLLRNLAWVWATLVWLSRRLVGSRPQPHHSMGRGR